MIALCRALAAVLGCAWPCAVLSLRMQCMPAFAVSGDAAPSQGAVHCSRLPDDDNINMRLNCQLRAVNSGALRTPIVITLGTDGRDEH